jgi:hypothetical protein
VWELELTNLVLFTLRIFNILGYLNKEKYFMFEFLFGAEVNKNM